MHIQCPENSTEARIPLPFRVFLYDIAKNQGTMSKTQRRQERCLSNPSMKRLLHHCDE